MNNLEFRPVRLLSAWLLAGCAACAAGVVCTASAQEANSLAGSLRPGGSPTALLRFGTLQLLLAGTAAMLTGLAAWGTYAAARPPGAPGGPFGHRARPAAWQVWQALPAWQRRLALGALGGLTALRLVVGLYLVTVDDAASYEAFVRKSLLTVSAFYPVPNNHVFSNTLSWLFYQVHPGYWWSMRLPIWLLSTVTTAGWFLGLLRRSNFRVAALATLLFGLLELSLFYAAEGRGYALLLGLGSIGFFCALDLLDVPSSGRAWAGLAVAGVVGLYTVPTFAYFLVAAYGWLGGSWLRRRQWPALAGLVALAAATLLGAALLYAPLLWVSGPDALLHNSYVRPLGAAFWPGLPLFVWELEGGLLGESRHGVLASVHAGSVAAAVVLVGFGLLVRAARRGRLPAEQAAYIRRLGVPALWFVGLPYVLMLAQQVQAPARTLWFKAAFMFVLIALEADWLLRQAGPSQARRLRLGLGLGIGLWAAAEVGQLYRSNELRLSYLGTPRQAARWLMQQPPGPVLAPGSPWYAVYLPFFVHTTDPLRQLQLDVRPQPGVRYRYLIAPAGGLPPAAPPRLRLGRTRNCEAITVGAYW